jgi:hypothetical protein
MGLGYMLLAVKSEQDKYLVGNPQFTYFKGAYKRHTHFALDPVYVPFIGETANSFGKKIYIDIPKSGDLLHRMYLVVDITSPNKTDISGISPYAYSLIEYIDIYIDGQLMDRHYSEWLVLYEELFQDKRKQLALASMISAQDSTTNTKSLYIPFRFWFNNDIGLSLPLIALQYSDVRIEIKMNTKDKFNTYIKDASNNTSIANSTISIDRLRLLCEYIHLDKDERVMFSSKSLEYLITQVQSSLQNPVPLYITDSNIKYEQMIQRFDLRFNHPVKTLLWTIKDNLIYTLGNDAAYHLYDNTTGVLAYNFWRNGSSLKEQMMECNLVMNGKDVTEPLPGQYFRYVQEYQHYINSGLLYLYDLNTSLPLAPASSTLTNRMLAGTGVYMYSFAFNPTESQPSGTVNFSKLEQAQLKMKLYRDTANFTQNGTTNLTSKILNIYALNVNVLRIMSGKAGLAFAT